MEVLGMMNRREDATSTTASNQGRPTSYTTTTTTSIVPPPSSTASSEESSVLSSSSTVDPLFTAPPPTSTTCPPITTTLSYSESGVLPWPYTGCATNLSAWIPNYTLNAGPQTNNGSTPTLPPTSSASSNPSPAAGTGAHEPPKSTTIAASTVSVGVAVIAVLALVLWYKKRRQDPAQKDSFGTTSSGSVGIGVSEQSRGLMARRAETVGTRFEDTRPGWTTGGHRDYGFGVGRLGMT